MPLESAQLAAAIDVDMKQKYCSESFFLQLYRPPLADQRLPRSPRQITVGTNAISTGRLLVNKIINNNRYMYLTVLV
jgi:hypothetical protein